jgi:regulator of sigma E protease
MNALIFIVVLVILIFIHELGHFLAARLVGIKVDEFGLGFPPRIWSKKKGETLYSLNALPLGGFVKLAGEYGTADTRPGTFAAANVWRRIFVVVAGVIMNFALAWLIFAVGYQFGLPPVTQDLTRYRGAVVSESDIQVGRVVADSPAALAGLETGDILVAATDQSSFTGTADFQAYTRAHAGQSIQLTVEREAGVKTLSATLGQSDAPLGVEIASDMHVKLPFGSALRAASAEVWGITTGIGQTLWRLVSSPLNSRATADLSGPIGIYQATSAAAQAGGDILVLLVALLSVNLAVLNILPIPALDGGRLAFLIIEAVARRRVVREEIEGLVTTLGFILMIGLLVLLTVRDIIRL